MTGSPAIKRRVESETGQYIGSAEPAASLRRTVPRGVLLRAALLSFCLTACAAGQTPTARQLLDNYTKALDSLTCVVIKAETTCEGGYAFDKNWQDSRLRGTTLSGTTYSRSELRTDGRRLHHRQYDWGNITNARPDAPANQPTYRCFNWDDGMFYQHSRDVNVPGLSGSIILNELDTPPKLSRNGPLSYLMGYNLESDERLDSILGRAESIAVRLKTERISGSDCWVIDGKTDSGRISLWLDPAHGYHAARAEAELAAGELAYGRPMPKGWAGTTRLDNVRFEKIGGLWAPMEADVSESRLYGGNNRLLQKYHHKRTMVLVNPDHDALGSFENPLRNPANDPELRNGTDVMLDNKTYDWRHGNVVDDAGKVIIEGRRKESSGREEKSQSSSAESSRKSPTQPKQPNLWQLIRKSMVKKQAPPGPPDSASTQSTPPTARELLDRYTRALESVKSIIVKAEITNSHEYAFGKDYHEPMFRGVRDKGTCYQRTEFRTDGRRLHSRQYRWGHLTAADPAVPEEAAAYNCLNYVGTELYQNTSTLKAGSPGRVRLHDSPNFRMRGVDKQLMGYSIQSDERLDAILRRARSISVRERTEKIGGSECYVMDANTDTGRISAWIDPAHGWHLAKVQAAAKEGDLYWGRALQPGWVVANRIDGVRFEKIDGVWAPAEADMGMVNQYGPGSFTRQKTDYKRTQILVNPDHDAVGSFDNPLENPKNDPQLKNGARVYLHDGQKRYIFSNGKLTPDRQGAEGKGALRR